MFKLKYLYIINSLSMTPIFTSRYYPRSPAVLLHDKSHYCAFLYFLSPPTSIESGYVKKPTPLLKYLYLTSPSSSIGKLIYHLFPSLSLSFLFEGGRVPPVEPAERGGREVKYSRSSDFKVWASLKIFSLSLPLPYAPVPHRKTT